MPEQFEQIHGLEEFPKGFNSEHWFPIDQLAIARLKIFQGMNLAATRGDEVYLFECPPSLSNDQRLKLASELIDRFPGRIRYAPGEPGRWIRMDEPKAVNSIHISLKFSAFSG